MKLFTASVGLICLLTWAAFASVPQTDHLHLVKKIYLESIVDASGKELPITPYLKQELEKNGFTIVHESTEADAILTCSIMPELPLDGGDPNRLRYIHEVELNSPGGVKIWGAIIKVYFDVDDSRRIEKGARKISDRMYNDWKKSAKRVGENP